ncbi:MAG: hypothetical protein QM770_07510 [Tepidisphaeraceae bacterium]
MSDLPNEDLYAAPKELATRWKCSRSSVERIARRNRLTKLILGDGRNGLVRYLWKEILAFEARNRVALG